MSQDHTPPKAAENRSAQQNFSQLQAEHDALPTGPLPSLAEALAELEEAPMRPLPQRAASTPPTIPSIALLTGILTGEATAEEKALWEEHYAGNPRAEARLDQLKQSASKDLAEAERQSLHQEQEALLTRGQQLLGTLPPLSADQLAQLGLITEDVGPSEGIVAALSTEENEHVAPDIGLAPTPAPAPTGATPGWQSWLGWSAPVLLTMGWLLIWQPPVDRSVPSWNVGDAPSQSTPIYRPAPAKAAPKGLGLPQQAPALSIELHRRRGSKIDKMSRSFRAKDGDQARFWVKQPLASGHVITLFLVESSGAVTYLYPSRADGKHQLASSPQGAYLKGGINLTTPKRPERIYGCIATKTIGPQKLKAVVADAMKRKSLARLARLPLPCVYQTSWYLQPPRR